MIRILSSRKLRFYSPDRKESIVTEGKNIIQEMPEWVVKDSMFKTAKNCGIIQVLESRSVQKVAENNPEKLVPQNAHEAAPFLAEGFAEASDSDEASEEDKEAAKKAARKAARKAKKEAKEEA